MTVKSSARVGYLNAILSQGGGNLNNSIFKSSNARGLPGGGWGMLMFRIDRRISGKEILAETIKRVEIPRGECSRDVWICITA